MPAERNILPGMNLFASDQRYHVNAVSYPPGGTCGPRTQRNLQIVYLLTGSVTVTVDEAVRTLRPGEMTLLWPGGHEFYQFAHNEPSRHAWVDAIDVATLPPALRLRRDQIPDVLPMSPTCEALLELALHGPTGAGHAREPLATGLAQALFGSFLHAAGLRFQTGAGQALPEPLRRLGPWVDRHLAEALSVPDLARAAGVSPQHLGRLCREHYGLGPLRWLWRRRCEAARALLADTGLRHHEIATRCGFASPYHFSRLMRTTFGAPPKELRRRAWGLGCSPCRVRTARSAKR